MALTDPAPTPPSRPIVQLWRPTQRFACEGVSFDPEVPIADHELVRRILAEYPLLFEPEFQS